MMGRIIYRHNVININSIDTFLSVKGGFNKGLRDVYFVRVLGVVPNIEKSIVDIDKKMDMEARHKRLSYKRIKYMPNMSSFEDVQFYTEQFENWRAKRRVYLKNNNTEMFSDILYDALTTVLTEYKKIKTSLTESIEKNFVVKMLFWMDNILGESLKEWDERKCYKIIVEKISKEQDYLFCYMLTLVGCDVLMLQYDDDVHIIDEIKNKSCSVKMGAFGKINIPEYIPYTEKVKSRPVNISRPDRDNKAKQTAAKTSEKAAGKSSETAPIKKRNTEKSFEELATLASSVVMITVINRYGEPEATGSGIMIGKDGYILTNNHVIEDGAFFAVQIEGDENVYKADGVIKMNRMLDLAIIRIPKKLKPIPIYRGKKKLVRGQRVVAIGSPLGLFNSVSDGIISGFRTINDVDMIQFTAPISHGSSGGAVLNMQGQVIGISTAGIDKGQNINLAVGYENILFFTRGFC